jgi:hypothetical protein
MINPVFKQRCHQIEPRSACKIPDLVSSAWPHSFGANPIANSVIRKFQACIVPLARMHVELFVEPLRPDLNAMKTAILQ